MLSRRAFASSKLRAPGPFLFSHYYVNGSSRSSGSATPLLVGASRFCTTTTTTAGTGDGGQPPVATPPPIGDVSLEERVEMLERVISNFLANAEAARMHPAGAAPDAAAAAAAAAPGTANRTLPRKALNAVVKVFTSAITPDQLRPWQAKPLSSSTGTAFVVDRERRMLLTNAHVVAYGSLVEVRRHGEARRFAAEIVFISGDCDLALLRCDDDAFWSNDDLQAPPFFSGVNGAICPELPTPPATAEDAADQEDGHDEAPADAAEEMRNGKTTLDSIARIGKANPFEAFPSLQSPVAAAGYPVGGDSTSVTSGVVSRIELTPYSTSGLRLASLQVDAAINPGNSGGPAFAIETGEVVGAVFQSLVKAEGISYLIPNVIIGHFVRDYLRFEREQKKQQKQKGGGEDDPTTPEGKTKIPEQGPSSSTGYHRGFCLVGVYYQEVAAPVLRESLKLPDSKSGFLIEKLSGPTNADVLKPRDVVCSVSGLPIERDITIEWRPGERLPFTHLIHMAERNHSLNMQVWREGAEENVQVTAKVPEPLVRSHLLHPKFERCAPPFCIYAGNVFTILSVNYLESWGNQWGNAAPRSLVNSFIYDESSETVKEKVVLSTIIPHPVNRGYSPDTFTHRIVETVNGKAVRDFQDFRQRLKEVANDEAESYVFITLLEGSFPTTMVLPKVNVVREADSFLTKHHGIPTQNALALD